MSVTTSDQGAAVAEREDGLEAQAVSAPCAAPAVVFDEGTGTSFEVLPGMTVLEAGLEQGVDLAHGCRVGVCGACAMHVIEGAANASIPDAIESNSLARYGMPACARLACRMRTTGPLRVRPG